MVKLGVSIPAGDNNQNLGTFGAPMSPLTMLTHLDRYRDTLADALGIAGLNTAHLYPACYGVWCKFEGMVVGENEGTSPPGSRFPSSILLDGLRDRGIVPLINWYTLGETVPDPVAEGGTPADEWDDPHTTTLAASVSIGATNIKVASVEGLTHNSAIYFAGANTETLVADVVGTAGPGGTGVTLMDPATKTHANGVSFQFSRGNATALRILDGHFDDYIDTWSQAAIAWRDSPNADGQTVQCRDKSSRIIVRLDWEHTGTWFSWRPGVMGTTTQGYIDKWRYIVDRVRVHNGATNVLFNYCPWETGGASTYPGDAYVHFAGADAYDESGSEGSLQSIFTPVFNAIRSYSSRPILIAEYGINDTFVPADPEADPPEPGHAGNDAHRADWIRDGMAWLDTQDDVEAMVYYDKANYGIAERSGRGPATNHSTAQAILAYAEAMRDHPERLDL